MATPAHSLDFQFRLLDLRPEPVRPRLVPDPAPAPPLQKEALTRLRASLDASVASKITNASELFRSLERVRRDATLPTTLPAFDTLLGGGLPRGKMTELTSRWAAGRFSVALAALASATSAGEAGALIDLGDHFDPQLAEADGVDLRRLLWVRPQSIKDAVMSAEMVAATGFQLVVIDLGLHPLRGRRAPEASWVRLARSAEANGAALLVSTPYPLTGTASEAVVKGDRGRAQWLGRGKAPRLLDRVELAVTLEKHRHMKPGSRSSLAFLAER